MAEFPVSGSPESTPNLVMRECRPGAVNAADWDDFVRACGGSFLGTWPVIRATRVVTRVRVFEFFTCLEGQELRKVGQCAVAVGRGHYRFLDRLHLLPDSLSRWDGCLRLLVGRCGGGRYEYGSAWNAESRHPPTSRVAGLKPSTLQNRPFLIDFVDFARYNGFEAYRRAISENIRRDYKKAAAAGATIQTRYGVAALRDVWTLVKLRGQVMERNQEPFSPQADIGLHILKLLCIGQRAFISTVRAGDGHCAAAFFGVQFGDDFYHVAGGTEKSGQGFGSFLFLTLIEEWMAAHPTGKLYLGRQLACVDPSTYTHGNALYRRKLRAQAQPGAEFELAMTRLAQEPAVNGALAGSTT